MGVDEGQEEYDEVQAELRKKEDEVGGSTASQHFF